MKLKTLLAAAFAFLLAACDAFVTGESVATFPVTVNADGSYAPVKLALGPEMNPIALNIVHSYTGAQPTGPKFNDYKATLTLNGQPVSTGAFNVTDASTPEATTGAPSAKNHVMTVSVKEIGDYELVIVRNGPAHVSLAKPEIELRKNIKSR